MSNYVPGSGPISAQLMIVGEAPRDQESYLGETLVGQVGQEIDKILRGAGSSLSECWKTNVSKWAIPGHKFSRIAETGHSLTECYELLEQEIREVKPTAILSLGPSATAALTHKENILNWRGSILTHHSGYPKVVPSIHPEDLHHRKPDGSPGLPYFYRGIIELDFRRAVEESQYREYKIPQRTLEIVRDPTHLLRFLNQYRNHKRLSIDLEVINAIPSCIGLAFSSNHAISVPLFNPFDWYGEKAIQNHILVQLWDILANYFATHQDLELIGQNFKFDHEKIQAILRWSIQNNIYCDTSLSAHTLQPELPKSLQFNTSIKTREPYYKDELKEFNPKIHKTEQILIYNARDAAVTFEIAESDEKELRERGLWTFYQELPNRLHELYLQMDRIGFKCNEEKRLEIYDKYAAWVLRNNAELEVIMGYPVNVYSPIDVPKVLKELGLPFKAAKDFPDARDTGAGEDILVNLYIHHANDPKQKRVLKLIHENRRVRKQISSYILSPADFDGRMRTIFNIAGTENARTASQALSNPNRPVKKKPIGWAIQTVTKHGDIGPEVRELIVADEGMEFSQIDLSQAEARIVAILSDDTFTLDLFARTDKDKSQGDFHDSTAHRVLGTQGIASGDERFLIKKVRYGGSYGMEKRRMKTEINSAAFKYGVDVQVSEYRAGVLLNGFHDFTPSIRGNYHPSIQSALSSNNRILVNAYGRQRQFLARWGEDLFREAYSYIPSSTVHDHIALACLRITGTRGIPGRASWLIPVIDAHDAFVFTHPIEKRAEANQIMREEFEQPMDFGRCSLSKGKLIIPCDIEVGLNYRALKKVARVA